MMTDEQIIKALECCATDKTDDCFRCSYDKIVYNPGYGWCADRCREDALNLINRQKAEIERLKKNIDGLNIFTTNHMKVIRLQAIKEFAERLCKGRVENDPIVIAVKAELDYVIGVGLDEEDK